MWCFKIATKTQIQEISLNTFVEFRDLVFLWQESIY